MQRSGHFYLGTATAVGVAAPVATPFDARAQGASAVAIDSDDIGGVVWGPGGPEAGVRVIAETGELPTRFARMVVTGDRGRYVVPDQPHYKVWVRGYGLIDPPKSDADRGKPFNLTAMVAPSDAAAARRAARVPWPQEGGKGMTPMVLHFQLRPDPLAH
jgi:hypothetical protein